jgi:hypothetical protein
MANKHSETTARDGWITFVLSLTLWGGLLGLVLYVGHQLGLRAAH